MNEWRTDRRMYENAAQKETERNGRKQKNGNETKEGKHSAMAHTILGTMAVGRRGTDGDREDESMR